MALIEVLYSISATIAIGACIPQVWQLWRSKSSEEFSLQSWVTWTLTQMVTLVYVISIGSILMAVVNAIWVSFYGFMTVLIVRYRKPSIIPATTPTVIASHLAK